MCLMLQESESITQTVTITIFWSAAWYKKTKQSYCDYFNRCYVKILVQELSFFASLFIFHWKTMNHSDVTFVGVCTKEGSVGQDISAVPQYFTKMQFDTVNFHQKAATQFEYCTYGYCDLNSITINPNNCQYCKDIVQWSMTICLNVAVSVV